jgi:hypothetical protein
MSERWATACRGKRRYNSMRKAEAAAKSSQIVYGVPMNAYGPCEFCHKWHVGNTFADNGKRARMERIGDGENSLVSSVDNQNE